MGDRTPLQPCYGLAKPPLRLMPILRSPARRIALCLSIVLLGHAAIAQQAASPSPDSGLCAVVPATTAQDLIARTKGGRVLVHALAADPAAAARLQAEVGKGGASGLVSVMHWDGFPALPYAEDLVDELVIDPAGLAGKVPTKAEIDRVLVPKFGVARIRQGGAWTDYRRPMPSTYGEWTHYYYDATNNPVGSDQATGISTGVRWIAEAQCAGGSHQLIGNGRLIYFNVGERSNFGGQGGGSLALIRARNAFNGLPLWDRTNRDAKKNALMRYEGAVLDGDRLIHLRSRPGPLVASSMSDGKELMVYDAAVININAESVRIPATTGGEVNTMLILEGRLLYVASGKDLTVLNADTGKLVWRFSADPTLYLGFPCIDRKTGTLAIAIGPQGMAAGRMTHFRANEYRGFDAATGKPRWTTANPITDYIASMCTFDGGVYVASAGHLGSLKLNLMGMDAATGAIRWKDLDMDIGASGTLMIYPKRAYVGRSALSTFDLADGKLLGVAITGNARCDVPRGSATTINNFGHFFDVTDPTKAVWNRREIVRNSCGGATLPAYGLRFSSDNRCGCFAALRGLVVTGHQPVPAALPNHQRLMKGPAYTRPLGPEMQGWTSFLGNDRRAGAGGPIKADKPAKRWQAKVATSPASGLIADEWRVGDSWNGPVTPPTIANGKVYVAETTGHRLVCLDADSGKELWSFPTSARIDGPPRLVRGRAVFGCRDGSVYCLDAADGTLAWRFLAAPSNRFITAYGQLESAWPVFGAVAVSGETVLAAAGRHPEADGGISVWGLKLATGDILWNRVVNRERDPVILPQTGGKFQPPKAEMTQIFDANRVVNDLIIADKTVFVVGGKRMQVADGADCPEEPKHPEFQLMPSWGNFASPVRRVGQNDLGGPGGWGGQWGIMDDNLVKYSLDKQTGKLVAGRKGGVFGRPICVDSDHILIQLYGDRHGGLEPLICYPRSAARDGGQQLWEVSERELRRDVKSATAANSMIVAGDRIVMTTSIYEPGDRNASTSQLSIRSLADGKLLHTETLPVPTVDHGLATANGRLYLSMDDGTVMCME
jgi:outer membrane protein assembly factor BamB